MRGMPVMLSAGGGSPRWGQRGEEGACVTFPSSPRDTQNKAVHHGKSRPGGGAAERRASNATVCVYERKREGWNQPRAEKGPECGVRNRVWREIITSISASLRSFRVAGQRRHHSNRFRHREAALRRRHLAAEGEHYTVNSLT